MRPLISEFSFGYALTEELASGHYGSLHGAPVFPTQNQEGNIGGYDVELPLIGLPIFLQFKLSDYLSMRSANEWGQFNCPYYRMHLRPLRFSDQHNLLLDWEAQGNQVYYVAPEFHKQDELNQYYLAHSIVDNSSFFSPSDIGTLPDHLDHYVVYTRDSVVGWFCSNERRKVKKRFQRGGFSDYFEGIVENKKHKIDLDLLELQNTNLIEFLDKRSIEVDRLRKFEVELRRKKRRSRKEAAIFLAYLSRTYFDAQLIFVTNKE